MFKIDALGGLKFSYTWDLRPTSSSKRHWGKKSRSVDRRHFKKKKSLFLTKQLLLVGRAGEKRKGQPPKPYEC